MDIKDWINQYGKRVYGVAHKILQDTGLAEDAAQQAFSKAWQHRSELKDPKAAGAWLCRIAFHEALTIKRKRTQEREALERLKTVSSAQTHDPGASRLVLQEAVDHLLEPTQSVIILRKIYQFSGNETADMLGLSTSEVSRQLYKGMMEVRRFLQAQK